MSAPQLAGVGFFAHTGWAAAVALAGPLDAPRVAASSCGTTGRCSSA